MCAASKACEGGGKGRGGLVGDLLCTGSSFVVGDGKLSEEVGELGSADVCLSTTAVDMPVLSGRLSRLRTGEASGLTLAG